MSRTTRSHPRRPLALAGFVLIALAASATTAATARTQRRSLSLHQPIAAPRAPIVVTPRGRTARPVDGEQALRSHGSELERDRTSAYFAEFTGVGAEGRDMIWRGAVAGTAVGELTVRLAHVGRDVDTAKPTWPVEGIIFVSGADPRRAFAAEVHGTIDWPTKRVTLAGEVSVGYLRGAHVEQTADLIDYHLSGELRLAPATLAAR